MQELAAAAFNILNENKDLLPSTSSMPVYEDLYFQPDEQWMPLPPMEPHDIKDTSIVLHSSGNTVLCLARLKCVEKCSAGSTAFPKPIHWAHFTHLVAGRWPRELLSRLDVRNVAYRHRLSRTRFDWNACILPCGSYVSWNGCGGDVLGCMCSVIYSEYAHSRESVL